MSVHDRRRWFLVGLAILTLVAVTDLYLNAKQIGHAFSRGFDVKDGPSKVIR